MNPTAPPYDPTTNVSNYMTSNPMLQAQSMTANSNLSKFQQMVKQRELNPHVAEQLYDVLSNCEVVLLCDDSDSMSLAIAEEGTDPFAPRNSTRWIELKKLAAAIIQIVTSINENGLDIYFLNRQKITNVNSLAGLQNIFSVPPNGDTNIVHSLIEIYNDKKHLVGDKKLLIVVITDGEPTDDTTKNSGRPGSNSNARDNLFRTINYIVNNGSNNIHVSFAECTDNAEDMSYLDGWDGLIPNFDNTDDYREELMRVKNIQGNGFKFDYTDYVVKILLATFVRWYFNLDQIKLPSNQSQSYNNQYIGSNQIYQPPVQQAASVYIPPPLIYPTITKSNPIAINTNSDSNQTDNGTNNQKTGTCCTIL